MVGVAALVGAEDTGEAEADADVAVSWRFCAPGGKGTVDIGAEALTVSLDCTTVWLVFSGAPAPFASPPFA